MSDMSLNLSPLLYHYLQENSLRESDVQKSLREQTHKMSTAHMQISPEQAQLMGWLIELMGAKKTLDIGVFTGSSALAVALALPSDGKVIGCDTNREWTKIAQRFWEKAGVSHKIDLRIAPALETLQQLLNQGEGGTFDFAFIDADKKNYPAYYELSLSLVRKGGVILIDNVLFGGKVVDQEAMDVNTQTIRALNAALLVDQRISLSMLPVGDGLTLVRKR